jgi:hypothetical protein
VIRSRAYLLYAKRRQSGGERLVILVLWGFLLLFPMIVTRMCVGHHKVRWPGSDPENS